MVQVVLVSRLLRACSFDLFFSSSLLFFIRGVIRKVQFGKNARKLFYFSETLFLVFIQKLAFSSVLVMKERIRSVMDYAKMSQQDFASALGISPASLSSIFTGRTNPTGNHVTAIHRAFPEINVNWLMFGEGEMMTKSSDAENSETNNPAVTESTSSPESLSLFPEERVPGHELRAQQPQKPMEMPRDTSYDSRARAFSYQNTKTIDKPMRKIREIRVFFDDGTYESFVPSSK